MPISPRDWAELMLHLRTRTREVGLADIDDALASDFQPTESSARDVIRYLSGLISGLKERSKAGYKRALDGLAQNIETEAGQQIDGIEIAIQERDQILFGTNRVDLAEVPDYEPVIRQLIELRTELEKEVRQQSGEQEGG